MSMGKDSLHKMKTVSLNDIARGSASKSHRKTGIKVKTRAGMRCVYERQDGTQFFNLNGVEVTHVAQTRQQRWGSLMQIAASARQFGESPFLELRPLNTARGTYMARLKVAPDRQIIVEEVRVIKHR